MSKLYSRIYDWNLPNWHFLVVNPGLSCNVSVLFSNLGDYLVT